MAKRDQIKWNHRYGNLRKKYTVLAPSDCLIRHQLFLLNQPKRKVLDLACGMGRNSFYLAKMGFEVDAWDISNIAISYINNNKNTLSINARQIDLDEVVIPKKVYSIILNFNFLDRKLFPKIKAALPIGGLIFFESFSLLQNSKQYTSETPKYTLGQKELLNEFSDFEIIDYQEFRTKRKGKGKVSLVAKKIFGQKF